MDAPGYPQAARPIAGLAEAFPYLRCVPNIIAMKPKDEDEQRVVVFVLGSPPCFIRYPRRRCAEAMPVKDQRQEIGKAEVVESFASRGGRKVALFGRQLYAEGLARKASEQLRADGFDVAIINPRDFTKPIDEGTTAFFGRAANDRGHLRGSPFLPVVTAALFWSC